jgi:hypothetical protein
VRIPALRVVCLRQSSALEKMSALNVGMEGMDTNLKGEGFKEVASGGIALISAETTRIVRNDSNHSV